MGVKKLFTFLNNNNLYLTYTYLNDIITDLNINKKQMLVGVDGNLFCYKYTHSYDNMLIGFFNQILKFLSNKIIPLYIFDGGTLQEKENTNWIRNHKKNVCKHKLEQLEMLMFETDVLEDEHMISMKKKLQKNSMKINNEQILLLLELFELLNIPYIFSHGEGEYLAVMLNKYNIIDFFLTDDTDPIVAGVGKTIKFYNGCVYYLDTSHIGTKLNINKSQFCDFCILLGSDYYTPTHNLKPNEIYNLITRYHSIERIVKYAGIPGIDPDCLNIVNKIRKIYNDAWKLERELFIENNYFDNNLNNRSKTETNINMLINHENFSYYSTIMLEYWDELIQILNVSIDDLENDDLKKLCADWKGNIYKYVSESKFNVRNIIRFIKNNIEDITDDEITNAVMSFEFLNTFGI